MDMADTAVIRQHLIDPEICIRCNTCEATCPVGAITHDDRNYVVDADKCNFCMACISPCPTGSIDNWRTMPRVRAYTPEEENQITRDFLAAAAPALLLQLNQRLGRAQDEFVHAASLAAMGAHPAFQVVDAGAAFDEAGVEHQLLVQRDVGLDAFDEHLGQRDAHPADGLVAGVAVGDQLADHRVVVLRHGVAVVHVGVDADAGAAGYVLKDIRGQSLLDGIRRVANGESLLARGISDR